MFAASLAAPLAVLATLVIALLLIAMGVLKLVPAGTVDVPATVGNGAASAYLLRLATGGIIDGAWGGYLVGVLQLALGIGLLVPAARAMAGLGCLLAAVAVVVGMVFHWSSLSTASGLNATGVSLIYLSTLLVAGAAFGTRDAAQRIGAAR
jgi:hypothetical protein